MKNVVVLDDNVQFAIEMAEFIEKPNKSRCIAFSKPTIVLEHLEKNHVDILVTDYEMPEINGIQLANIVLEKYPNVRIIVMSGHDAKYLEQICKKHKIYGKVDTVCKSNIDFFSTLI